MVAGLSMYVQEVGRHFGMQIGMEVSYVQVRFSWSEGCRTEYHRVDNNIFMVRRGGMGEIAGIK